MAGLAAVAVLFAVDLRGAQRAARWPPGARIRVWIGASPARRDDPAFAERALRVWTRAGRGRFALERSTDQANSEIRIQFGNGEALLGETRPAIDGRSGFIAGGEIGIAVNLPGDRLQQRIVVYMTALHELGHALGLRHSDDFDDIMYLFRRPEDPERYFGAYRRRIRSADDIGSPRATGLSPRDLDALNTLYGPGND